MVQIHVHVGMVFVVYSCFHPPILCSSNLSNKRDHYILSLVLLPYSFCLSILMSFPSLSCPLSLPHTLSPLSLFLNKGVIDAGCQVSLDRCHRNNSCQSHFLHAVARTPLNPLLSSSPSYCLPLLLPYSSSSPLCPAGSVFW